MCTEFENSMLKLIKEAKDTVEHYARIYMATWHSSLFGNNCLRTSIGFYVYGDAYPYGFVFIDSNNGRVSAYDASMNLLKWWEIT